MKKHFALLFILLGAACAPVSEPTPTAVPTPTVIPTPTPIPLSQLDIETLLVLDGDLPEDIIPDTITNENAVGSEPVQNLRSVKAVGGLGHGQPLRLEVHAAHVLPERGDSVRVNKR